MSKPAYFLGIDGGGSRTKACLADARGRALGCAAAGPSNPTKVGIARAMREIVRAAEQARRAAGLRRIRIEAVCAGIAGAASAEVHRSLLRSLRRRIPAFRHLLTHDGAIALECALGDAAGVIVISGTGSIAFARDAAGRTMRCGGWGSEYGDEGSGYDIGTGAIRAALRELDGRGPHTRLGGDICRALGIRAITELGRLEPDRVAALFPVVHRAALAGDAVARRLCLGAGGDLAQLASVLLSRIGPGKGPQRVFCAGGVFNGGDLVMRSFRRELRREFPRAKIALLEREPVEGAVALAIAAARSGIR